MTTKHDKNLDVHIHFLYYRTSQASYAHVCVFAHVSAIANVCALEDTSGYCNILTIIIERRMLSITRKYK